MTYAEQRQLPMVLIAGGGLGGLLLGALLEKAKIPYYIFERATKVKPLGSAMALGSTVFPVFEQLGILEELYRFSLPTRKIVLRNGQMEELTTMRMDDEEAVAGYANRLFARPDLYELLLRQVPEDKILLSKKVLRVEEEDDKVFIHCSDNTSYEGDVLVGADGAYSAVRQNIMKDMQKEGILPKSDLEELVAGYTAAVGITKPMDPENYPQLKDKSHCHFENVVDSESLSWSVYCLNDNRICWGARIQYKSMEEAKKEMFMNSEWGPEANEAFLKEFTHKLCPYGGLMGDLIDATPKDLISKIYQEHKMFQTWFYKRSVLLGDACHKMLPAAGQGAANAFHDAVILANCLYDLKDNSQASITAAFQSYYDQRFQHAQAGYDVSKLSAKLMAGSTWSDRLVRTIVFKYLPRSIQQKQFEKTNSYRPQAMFLPLAPKRGTGYVLPQLPSERYAEEQKKRKADEAVVV
ncbi:hypothetical protein EMPS_06862 [Entomortierella parvispora]|uniref:FAD-binding domain-containing protein n=1 Tax=Entomortierella parvispora TaxID=205924 RepID=A0A9P3HD80_9FUNG|nr:hypothetical protein EMPS_06862 [Entomortierella parvispora]